MRTNPCFCDISWCYGNCLGGSQEVVSWLTFSSRGLDFESLEWKSRIWGLVLCLEGPGEAGAGAEWQEQGRSSILWREAGLKQKGPAGSGTQGQEEGTLWFCCFIHIFFSFLAEPKESFLIYESPARALPALRGGILCPLRTCHECKASGPRTAGGHQCCPVGPSGAG